MRIASAVAAVCCCAVAGTTNGAYFTDSSSVSFWEASEPVLNSSATCRVLLDASLVVRGELGAEISKDQHFHAIRECRRKGRPQTS